MLTLRDWLNYSVLYGLTLLTVNSLYADWTMNPVWDLFFARVRAPFFYGVHASSILSVCLMVFWKVRLDYEKITGWTFPVFSTASIHELSLASFDYISGEIDTGISFNYGLWLSIILCLGVYLASPAQRGRLLLITLFMYSFFILAVPFHLGVTLQGFQVTDVIHLAPNFNEVVSWLSPVSFWVIPFEWVYHRVRRRW